MWKTILIILVSSFFFSPSVFALDQSRPNNKFGIHLAVPDDADIKSAQELVNSSGGDWGYTTLVIQENDRSKERWQGVFDKLREQHLIPIIRLATQPEGANWKRPSQEDVSSWVSFLDSLNWPVKERYVILFNEPNHAAEWGGSVDAEHYAAIAQEFAKKLKEKNQDFFVMLAGLDAAAPSQRPQYEDEGIFLQTLIARVGSGIFDHIDGWSSHSYPNPGFAGSPYDTGRNSIRNYEWELSYLNQLGISKDLPVFITETGWPHNQGTQAQNYHSPDVLGVYTRVAFEEAWLADSRVRAVTPFLLNYQGEPFTQFSWKKQDSQEFYSHFFSTQAMAKTKGDPEQVQKGQIIMDVPERLFEGSTYRFSLFLKNHGQAIWDEKEGYKLAVQGFDGEYLFSELSDIKPNGSGEVSFYLKTKRVGAGPQKKQVTIALTKGDRVALKKTISFLLLPLPSLEFEARLFPPARETNRLFEIQIINEKGEIVFRDQAGVRKNKGRVDRVRNIYPGKPFKARIVTENYYPQEEAVVFSEKGARVNFKPLIIDLGSVIRKMLGR